MQYDLHKINSNYANILSEPAEISKCTSLIKSNLSIKLTR